MGRLHILALLALLAACSPSPGLFVAGPLFVHEKEGAREAVTLPLLLSRVSWDDELDTTDARILWPFGHYERKGIESTLAIWPFYWDRERIDHNGFMQRDFWVLPGLLAGRSAHEGGYFYFWPFGGTVKGVFGKDDAVLVGPWLPPPLAFFMWWRDKSMHSWHVLWPFFNYVSGGGYSGWRFFPLFGQYERRTLDGRLSWWRMHLMWPLFSWDEKNLDSAGRTRTVFLFPFYGNTESRRVNHTSVMWPLFSYKDVRGPKGDGTDDFWEVKAPWPLVVFHRGPNESRSDLWPIFGRRTRTYGETRDEATYERYERTFILEPLFRREWTRTSLWTDSKTWLIPIYWSFHREFTGPDDSTSEWKIWPLFRYKRDRDGTSRVDILSVLWFKDPEAFEAIYDPLFRVYHYRKDPETGVETTHLLWGLYSSRKGPEGASTWVHPFLYWSEESQDATSGETGFFFGFVRLRWRGAERGLSLFFLPEITWDAGEEVAP